MSREGLDLDNILTGDDFESLFEEETQEKETIDIESDKENEEDKEKDKEQDTAEVDYNNLFGEPESVGSEEDNKENEGTTSHKDGTSPNFYSSIANALRDDGIFTDLEDEQVNSVKTPADLRALIENQIKSGFDERQRRIDEALDLGIEPSVIKQYEQTLKYLDSIDESSITDESEDGEKLRKQLIYRDFLNRGFSESRAQRELEKSLRAGTDIDDAKEALKSNKEFFKNSYDKLVQDAKNEEAEALKERKNRAEQLKKSILEERQVFGDLEIDKATRQKIYDNISKPIYKDPETGQYLTAIQKYEAENSTDFIKKVGLLFTLTDGFKNLDKLVKGKVNKEVKKGLADLEHTLNNTSRTSGGSIRFAGGDDTESAFRGFTLDI